MIRLAGKRWLGLLVALAIASPADACLDGARGGTARVSAIYPTADELPENLIRFYVYFTEAMERQGILSSIELLDEDGLAVPGVFLVNRYELWSADDRRLTLILDPGRVKTGLSSHAELGRALTAGRRYTLVVRRDAFDAGGCRLVEEHRKEFLATGEDVSAPEIERWRLRVPMAQTKQPLSVVLDGPYDHVSLAYRLRVVDAAGEVVPGTIELADHETRWLFTPSAVWPAAPHHLAVETSLEDLAGNRPGRPFDRTRDQTRDQSDARSRIDIPFTPSSFIRSR